MSTAAGFAGRVVVTDAGPGIGLATALRFANLRAKVPIAGTDPASGTTRTAGRILQASTRS